MQGDVHLTSDDAEQLHQQQTHNGMLVMWVVTWKTSDYPQQAAARPRLIAAGQDLALGAVLLADSLDELREQLPPGLYKLDRNPDDDPVIMEVWL